MGRPGAWCKLGRWKTSGGVTGAAEWPAVGPPTTTILSPTTAAAPAARAWWSSGPSIHWFWAWSRYSTRAEATPDTWLPWGSKPPITHTVFRYDTIIA